MIPVLKKSKKQKMEEILKSKFPRVLVGQGGWLPQLCGWFYVRVPKTHRKKNKKGGPASAEMGARGYRVRGWLSCLDNIGIFTFARSTVAASLWFRSRLACLDDVTKLPISSVPSYHFQRRADLQG